MDSGILARIPEAPARIQTNHVIWGSIRRTDSTSYDCPSRNDWSGSGPENVVYKDWSTSADSLSGMNSNSNEPDLNPGSKAGERLPDTWKKKPTIEQEFLLKHGVWSVGSQGHVEGHCKPCHYVHSPKGCKSGFNCSFCHLPHVHRSSRSGNRPSKDKRHMCKELFDGLQSLYGGRLDESTGMVKEMASQSLYMQRLHKFMTQDDKNQTEQGQGPAVKEAQAPVHKPDTGRTRRAEAARDILKDLIASQTAKPAAAAAAAAAAGPGGAEKRRQSNLVSL